MSGSTIDSSSSSDSSDDEEQQTYNEPVDSSFYSIEEFIKQRRQQDNVFINELRKLPELLKEVTPERRARAQKMIVTYLSAIKNMVHTLVSETKFVTIHKDTNSVVKKRKLDKSSDKVDGRLRTNND